jgi:hypothetical protein
MTDDGGAALATGAQAIPALGDRAGAVFAGIPARLLQPFIYVWPAVALLTEGQLGSFVAHWSRSVLALLEENGTGSLPGESSNEAALAGSTTTSAHSGDQPPFSWLYTPSDPPFSWAASGASLPAFVFFLLLAAATLMIVMLMRRELGEPTLPRRLTRWRR